MANLYGSFLCSVSIVLKVQLSMTLYHVGMFFDRVFVASVMSAKLFLSSQLSLQWLGNDSQIFIELFFLFVLFK